MSEKISGIPEQEVTRIDYRSNEKQYQEIFPGGSKNYRFIPKYSDTEHAYKVREVLIK